MTSPLRSRVVEAGARAIANDRADEIDKWHFDDARVALDAMLDCLAENADEWASEATANDDRLWGALRSTKALLAVLREDR